MKIALDYDRTYTLDPAFWEEFANLCDNFGHEVRIVTARHPTHDSIDEKVPLFDIVYCNGVAKRFVCHHVEYWDPDIWIDDKPESIIQNGPLTRDQLAEWRKSDEHKA